MQLPFGLALILWGVIAALLVLKVALKQWKQRNTIAVTQQGSS
jgi:hypothetical protein